MLCRQVKEKKTDLGESRLSLFYYSVSAMGQFCVGNLEYVIASSRQKIWRWREETGLCGVRKFYLRFVGGIHELPPTVSPQVELVGGKAVVELPQST